MMRLEVHYLGRLPFYGDKVRRLIQRLAGADTVFGPVAKTREDLNSMVRHIRTSPNPALIMAPLAPVPMLPEVAPAAHALGMDGIELAVAFRDKLGSQQAPMLCPLAGRAFSDPAVEVSRMRDSGMQNALVVLAPNLVGASDIIANPEFRIPKAAAERVLASFFSGVLVGRPATSMAALAG